MYSCMCVRECAALRWFSVSVQVNMGVCDLQAVTRVKLCLCVCVRVCVGVEEKVVPQVLS